jgi:UDP-glucuronate decarboxylase
MKKILITGGAGFIGSSLAQRLTENKNHQVVIFDNFITGSIFNVPVHKQVTLVRGDANEKKDIGRLMDAYKFHYVFHYAATVGVKRTQENPIAVLHDIEGIKNILIASKKTGVNRIFFSSSSEVYGTPVEFPQNEETTPLNSRLPYAIVKNVGEAYLKSFQKEYSLNYTIFRFFNTYGANQSNDFVIPRFINAALHNEDLTIYGNGSQTRTFCYIDDNIDFTLKAIEGDQYINEVVNVGCNVPTSVLNLAQIIIALTGSKSRIVHLPPLKEGDMAARMPDNTKMLTLLNRKLTSLESGISAILKLKGKYESMKQVKRSKLLQPFNENSYKSV